MTGFIGIIRTLSNMETEIMASGLFESTVIVV